MTASLALRVIIYAAIFAVPALAMIVFGYLIIFPFFALMNWPHGEPEPIGDAFRAAHDGPGQEMVRRWLELQ